MKVTKVCCQGCGADLQVDESIRFVTCNYCHARLEIVHDSTVTHTRMLEHIGRTTEQMAGNLRVIELQNDLARLDREWALRRESFMVTGENGHRFLPTETGSLLGGGAMVLFGIVWMVLTSWMEAPLPFPLFGLLFIGFAIFGTVSGASKASDYRNAERQVSRQRSALLRQIEGLRKR
ncbi:hypothetical protein OKA04_14440 [Luteolibacter flavescens]|uniref:C2H2-type domain-containing protein n=1 Tax=Luteolibacter flavescens TaxID=1859460 RepID=A0ABT3FRV6_9BACT|nr:hypothetical protein [Luteolibacter flavescens]MCW1885934.1 hypothetical protein [Luteolibacter flavescens]